MMSDDGVKREIGGAGGGLRVTHGSWTGGGVGPGVELGIEQRADRGIGGKCCVELRIGRRRQAVREGEVRSTDDAVVGLEERVLEDAGQLAHVAGPGVLEEAGERAGSKDEGALLITGADAVEEKLGERGDVFAALAQRRNGEANRSEAKCEVGKKKSLTGHLAERSLRRGEQNGAARRPVLKVFEDSEKQALTRRCEKVDAIEIGETGEGGGIGVGGQPFAGIAALKGIGGEG